MRKTPAALFLAASIAACQSAAPSAAPGTVGPTPASSAPPAPSLTAGPSEAPPSAAAGTPFPRLVTATLDRRGPIIEPEDGPAGYVYSLPAAAARDRDGGYVLFTVWFGTGVEDVMITLNRSTDGLTWDVGRTPVFTLQIGSADPGPIPAAALQLDDGSWLLYGWSAEDDAGSAFSTWRASAPAPEGPWTLDEERVLAPGTTGSWDSLMAAASSVIRAGDEFRLWYDGEGPGREVRGDIGLATSSDGLAWQKFDDPATTDAAHAASDPVIPTGVCGANTSLAIEQAQVEPARDGFVAIFGGTGTIRSTRDLYAAVSSDGVAWRCAAPDAVLRGAEIPRTDGIHTIASLPIGEGRIGLIIESLDGNHSELWWATVEVDA